MISKELLSEILCEEITDIRHPLVSNKCGYILGYAFAGDPFLHQINIHELAHMCKEWANKKHNILIFSSIKGDIDLFYRDTESYDEWFMCHDGEEPKAIFKACQWILENK
jgi:hypothetical protein